MLCNETLIKYFVRQYFGISINLKGKKYTLPKVHPLNDANFDKIIILKVGNIWCHFL